MEIQQFIERLPSYKNAPAVVFDNRSVTFLQLYNEYLEWLDLLRLYNIKPGDCVAFLGSFTERMIPLTLALMSNRNIIVPIISINPGEEDKYLKIACVQLAIRFDDNNHSITNYDSPASHALLTQIRDMNEPGLILYTSGSTGNIKASVHRVSKLLKNILHRERKSFCTAVFLLLDHIGGMNTLLNVLAHGGTAIFLKERTAEYVCELIQRYKIQLLPTTPTFLNMLLISQIFQKYDLKSLELVTYGTELMSANVLSKLNEHLPWVRYKQTYGLTEAGILPTKSEDSDSLWLKIGDANVETKVVNNILWIRSNTVMLGYLNAPSPFEEGGWLNTGDLVEESNGYFRIIGRESEIINVGGEKVYPLEVENVIQQVANINDVVVYGKKSPILGKIVVATVSLIVPEDPQVVEKKVRTFCKEHLLSYKVPVVVEVTTQTLHSQRFKKVRKDLST